MLDTPPALHNRRSSRFGMVVPLLLAGASLQAADTPTWQSVGWGGGAYYFAAAWHPTESNVLYLGSDCAGVYRSENQAQQWEFANNGIGDYAIYSLAVSPAAPDLIYALSDGGLSKSADRGHHWTLLPASTEKANNIRSSRKGSVRAVAIDPVNADIVYAGSRTGSLWKTVDGGDTWSELAYRASLPSAPQAPSYSGSGSVRIMYDGHADGADPIGRMSKIYKETPEDWSAYAKLSARIQIPEGAPALQAQLVVQSGDSWKWQAGAWTDCTAGWTEIPLDLTAITDVNSVRMVHVAVRTFQPGWKGELNVDTVALHSTTDAAASKIIADWETKGDVEGWAANRQAKDSRKVTAISQSSEPRSAGDIVSGVAVASDGGLYVSNTKFGVFRSDDAGATWQALATPQKVLSVTVSPSDPTVVWAACGGEGAVRSNDRGATWTAVQVDANPKLGVREIALNAQEPERIYAIGSIGWGGFLFRSDDNGATWTKNNTVKKGAPGNPTLPNDNGGSGAGNDFCTLSTVTNIAVDPTNPDNFFIAGNWRNIFSSDGGKSLEERSTGADNTCATDIQFLDGKTYATAMDEGILVSDNNGGEWRQLEPLKYNPQVSGHFWRVRVAKDGDATRIVTATSPWESGSNPKITNCVMVSKDSGKSFLRTTAGLPDYVSKVNCMWGRSYIRVLAQHPTDPNILYVGMDGDPEPEKNLPGGGIFRSADGGETWTRCAGQPGSRRMYYGLVVDPSNPKRLYWSACGDGGGAYRSDDEGATWTQVFSAETWSFNCEVAPSGMVLVAGNNLHRSTDHGATWSKITDFGSDATIVGIAVDPADENRIWISRTTWSSSDHGGIYRTTDGGATWEEITGDIPFRKPQILRYNAVTHDLWAAGVGIFRIAQ